MEKQKVECGWCGEMKNEGAKVCCHCGRNEPGDLRVRVGFVSGMSIALGFCILAPVVACVTVFVLASLGYYR